MSDTTPRRSRLAAAAGLIGGATAFALLVGVGPAPSVLQLAGANQDVSGNCDEAEHASDPECAGTPTTGGTEGTTTTTVDDSPSTTVAPGPTATDVRAIDAAGAGTVLVAVDGGSLRLVTATPASGWRVEVEQSAGREIEVDFRAGTRRVQVNVELEDGQVRERVRVRNDADGTDIRTENGVVVRDDSADDNSNSGSGSDDSDDRSGSGHGNDDSTDDNSGRGSDDSDDRSGSGHGNDDDSGDDHGGSGHGSDDEPGDDHGGSGHGSDDD